MTTEKLKKLSKEEIQTKADSLSKVHNVKVHPLVFEEEESGEQIIGFIKEPARLVKMRVLDKALTSPISAASELLDIAIIKEESDARILSENPEHDKYYLGAVMAAMGIIKYSQDTFKKK
jgi:hypothetical protein